MARTLAPWATTIATATTATTTSALFLWARLVDGEIPSINILAGQGSDGSLSAFRSGHGNKAESPGSSAHPIHNEVDLSHGTIGGEHILQIVLRCVERKIAHV